MAKYQMIRRIQYKYKDKGQTYDINMLVDLSRFERQYSRAQYGLDSLVMSSMEDYMPMETGTFIKVTKAMSQAIAGSGKVYAAAPPFGRYLYFGKVMVDEGTGSPFARLGARKVLVSQYAGRTAASENIQYSRERHPMVEREWFDVAKRLKGYMWVGKVRRIAGGGKRG